MTNIRAVDASKALKAIAAKLFSAGVLKPEGRSTLYRVADELKRGRRSQQWRLFVDRKNPIAFNFGVTSDGKKVLPRIDYADIQVNQTHADRPPFDSFDLAVVIEDENGDPSSRWHLDQANMVNGVAQTGPLFHLQFGGRNHDQVRALDHPIKEPRWNHPPMDLALMCETILANFFEEEWMVLRDDPSWCSHICLFQNLCYENYLAKLQNCLGNPRGSTILKDAWASNWA